MQRVRMDSESRQRSELKGSLWSLNPLTALLIKKKNLILHLHTQLDLLIMNRGTHCAAYKGKSSEKE